MELVVDDADMTAGRRIELYRERRGLTQEALAQLMGVSVHAVRKWESDQRTPKFSTYIDMARVLRVRDLWKLTGMPVGDLPDEPGEHASVAPIRAAMTAFPPYAQDVTVDVDAVCRLVSAAWDRWHGCALRYSQTGPLLPSMLQGIQVARAVATPQERPRVLGATVSAYGLARAFCKRLGAHDLAMVAADRAMAAALEVDDPFDLAASAWNLATALSTQGYAEPAAQLCRDAIGALDAAPQGSQRAALTGSLHLLLAVQYARLGEPQRALDTLDVADRLAGLVGETNYYRTVFGPTNARIHRVAVEYDLGRPREALRIAERIDASGLPSVERRHTHLVDLATLFCGRRDDVAAVHVLRQAWEESPEESRLHTVYRTLVRQLLQRETPAIRQVLRPLAEQAGIA